MHALSNDKSYGLSERAYGLSESLCSALLLQLIVREDSIFFFCPTKLSLFDSFMKKN